MKNYTWAGEGQTWYVDPIKDGSAVIEPGVWVYDQAKKLVEAGEATIAPYAPPEPPAPVVPESVTLWQAREALRRAGLLAAVEAHIETRGVTDEVYNAWYYKDRVRRNSPLVEALAPQFNLTDEQLDNLFITAGGLE